MTGLKLLVLALSITALFAAYDPLCDPDWKMVSAGNNFTLALAKNGSLYAFGDNSKGQLGIGSSYSEKNTPQRVMPGYTIRFVIAKYSHAFAITTNGDLYAWGWNKNNVLGLGSYYTGDSIYTPRLVDSAKNWKVVATGRIHTLALTTSGNLYVWGDNSYGQLGAFTQSYSVPQVLNEAFIWKAISAGEYSSYGIQSNDILRAWGDNSYGQLGNSSYIGYREAVNVGSVKFKSVAAGKWHVLAVDLNDNLHAWGKNYNGELGQGTWSSSNQAYPEQVGNEYWRVIAAGDRFSLGIRWNNNLYAWGLGDNYRLGSGGTSERTSPYSVGDSWTWLDISAGENHAAGITADGRIRTWGHGYNGQIGGATWSPRTTPNGCYNNYDNTYSYSYSSSRSSSAVPVVLIVLAILGCMVGICVCIAKNNTAQKTGGQVVQAVEETQMTRLTNDLSGATPQFIIHQSNMNQRL